MIGYLARALKLLQKIGVVVLEVICDTSVYFFFNCFEFFAELCVVHAFFFARLSHPSEKYEFVSWDDDIPNIWKVIKFMFQSPINDF